MAEKRFRMTEAWRKQNGMDQILSWNPPEVLKKYFPGGFAGFDKDGSPVWVIPAGFADFKGLFFNIDFTLFFM